MKLLSLRTLLIIISGMVFSFYVFPQYDVYKIKSEHLKDIENLFNQAQNIREKISVKFEQYNSLNPEVVTLIEKSLLPYSDKNVAGLLIEISSIIRKAQLPFDSQIVTGSLNDSDEYISLSIDVSSSATYERVKNFISILQNWNRSIYIDSISIDSVESNPNLVDFSVEFRVLFYKQLTI